MKYPAFLIAAALLLAASSALFAAPAVQPTASFRFDPEKFRGDSARMIVNVSIPKGWHVQSNAPSDSFLIPTTVRAAGEGLLFGKPVFPKAVEKDFPALGGPIGLFEGNIAVRMTVKRKNPQVTAADLRNAQVILRYQACNDSQCLPPKEIAAKYQE